MCNKFNNNILQYNNSNNICWILVCPISNLHYWLIITVNTTSNVHVKCLQNDHNNQWYPKNKENANNIALHFYFNIYPYIFYNVISVILFIFNEYFIIIISLFTDFIVNAVSVSVWKQIT